MGHYVKKSSSLSNPTSIAGRVGATGFFLVFLGLGVLFLCLIAREAVRIIQAWHWATVPCVVEASSVTHRGEDYRFEVRYRYEFSGMTLHSDRFSTSTPSSSNYRDMHRWVDAYPARSAATCYVNPANPGEAVLRLGTLSIVLFTPIPLIFAAIGAFGIFMVWRPAPGAPSAPVPAVGRPMSRRAVVILMGIFILVGAIGFYFITLRVAWEVRAARDWAQTPCIIESSAVRSHTSSGSHGGTTYNVDILYRYKINGRTYRSNQYDFLGGSSSGYASKAAIVEQFPPGKHAVCYVNPSDPEDAVLDREYSWEMLFGLIPLLFIIIGIAGITKSTRPAQAIPSAPVQAP